jgi:hypothetical protein
MLIPLACMMMIMRIVLRMRLLLLMLTILSVDANYCR